ncbi:TrbI/VirB10 family protein [Porphyrobacter sp. TH134]|uniref:TrbI/VirB10 family protein n=1 Tax=Porphyrobacter sp. TH134 TaxID=2067450 RepID=UPI001F38671E|nr:TrbI/VirB10 family protein [Porphyrobacter sp. TH134]
MTAKDPAPQPPGDDGRPVVPLTAPGNWGPILFGVVLVAGGAMLFSALNAERAALQSPRTTIGSETNQGRIAAAPPLDIPSYTRDDAPVLLQRRANPANRADLLPPAPRRSAPQDYPRYVPPQGYIPPPLPPPPAAPSAPPSSSGPSFDQAFEQANGRQRGNGAAAASTADRVTARRLSNPSHTVPRGTVIPAVLETALDSTRPGPVRGLVQRNVHAFDGSRVLIPRGSRLYGEYKADLTVGQRRASVQWLRLLRPDGVTIELDSPASDPLGRAGVKGKVDNKFFQRFGGAILQSVLDIGVGVATRQVTDGLIVALPGSSQTIGGSEQQQIQPTLKVRQGTSLSVFVARDLDFSNVDP